MTRDYYDLETGREYCRHGDCQREPVRGAFNCSDHGGYEQRDEYRTERHAPYPEQPETMISTGDIQMIDFPLSFGIKAPNTYVEDFKLYGTWSVNSDTAGILPLDEFEAPHPDAYTERGEIVACYSVPSSKNDRRFDMLYYVVTRFADGSIGCTCPGFSYHNGVCSHLDSCEEAPEVIEAPVFEQGAADELLAAQAGGQVLTTVEILDVLVPREPQPFKAGDAIRYTDPRTGAHADGFVARVNGDTAACRFWDATAGKWDSGTYSLTHLTPRESRLDTYIRGLGAQPQGGRPVDAGQAMSDLFTDAA